MRRKKSNEMGEEEATINLTPLIDVVFVVLIMFILVAPMLELDRINLATASATKEKKEAVFTQDKYAIQIYVREDNSLLLNGKKIGVNELLPLLKEVKKRSPRLIPQIFHDKKAYFGTYQNVKNAVEGAGFEEMDLILRPN